MTTGWASPSSLEHYPVLGRWQIDRGGSALAGGDPADLGRGGATLGAMPRPVSNPPNPWAGEHLEYLGEPPTAELTVYEEHARSILSVVCW